MLAAPRSARLPQERFLLRDKLEFRHCFARFHSKFPVSQRANAESGGSGAADANVQTTLEQSKRLLELQRELLEQVSIGQREEGKVF